MSSEHETGEPLLAHLPGSVAHALNNVLSVLFGVASDLESPVDEAALNRARQAVAHACAGAQSLSAALNLAALAEETPLAEASAHRFPLRAFDLRYLLENLAATAELDFRPLPEDAPDVVARIDRDTLQSVLICAAISLRRNHGPRNPLHCAVVFPPAREPGVLAFELALDKVTEKTPGALDLGRHPCQIALEAAGPALDILGTQIETPRAGCQWIRVQCGEPG